MNNTAYARASNFAPAGGNPNDQISDTGKIIVTAATQASLHQNLILADVADLGSEPAEWRPRDPADGERGRFSLEQVFATRKRYVKHRVHEQPLARRIA